MSERLSPREFESTKEHWISLYTPISMRQMESWQEDWDEEFKRIRYMQFSRYARTADYGALHPLKGLVSLMPGALEGVKADIEQVWRNYFVRDKRAIHTFVDNPLGFEFKAMGLNDRSEYIAGRIIVIDRPKE
jgi:hypothetical protein